ncbi:putative ABC-2 type transport system permease protein [Trichormus variabilis ATCC 29413]|uniref:ABC-2 type transport system permease protein n=4 Tax=Anabaena variabilis TaxID=264691 RepID=Q3M9P0_TRIV2|nr:MULTISPECIES: ABC-2 family transporter protein [Nostocaceae]ABA22296.1 putative ABC-2 type transport system permease protein [Trichormus variabilis ATCC 29413]MBC1213520.1 ABC-2 family transporter protein [Trichormus variabilis ARAD]MBC1254052.1 ABC-2 family transporter protein [Trichormus variabilis V5]MBC1301842.1 ABC-2 family transporter protein [Trichormus variabilis N2B]MBC1311662.1 ABC-2 family transporter protein [Trichormus variabilis PNB]
MKKTIRKAWTLLTVYYAYMVEYRAELILWVLSGSLPIILMGAWIKAAQGGSFGLSPVDFARYFLTVFIVRQISVVWVIWEFEKEVVEGKLSPKLLQPLDPVWHHVASHLSERVARIPFAILLIGLFFILYPQALWFPTVSQLLLFTVAVSLAFVLRFVIQYTFAMFAFWTERANAIENFWFLFYLFLSGLIAPLDVFPPQIKAIVLFTPFPYLIDFPASLLVGLPVDVVQGFLSLLAWIFMFWVVNRLLWRAGLKKYSGMGA